MSTWTIKEKHIAAEYFYIKIRIQIEVFEVVF